MNIAWVVSWVAVKHSVDVGIASAYCGSTPSPGLLSHVEHCGRLPGMRSHCHQLPEVVLGLWVPQTFQALMACLQKLAGRNVNFS